VRMLKALDSISDRYKGVVAISPIVSIIVVARGQLLSLEFVVQQLCDVCCHEY
jgi:hypothetical protein